MPDHNDVVPARNDASPMLSTLDKGLRGLEALARSDSGSESLTSLSRAVGIHRTTMFRILGTLRAQIGSRRPTHCTAAGKTFLAALPEAEREAILRKPLAAFTPRTVTRPEQIRQQLVEVRRRGFAWDDEEYLDGVRCVAAPVFGIDRGVVGVISLAAPTMRAPWERLWRLGAQVSATAREISACLGAPDDCLERVEIQEAS